MILRWKRNGYALRMQIVCAVDGSVESFDDAEQELVKGIARGHSGAGGCTILQVNPGRRWLEILVEFEPGFDPSKFIKVVKTETSRSIRRQRGGVAGIWAPGYVAATIGDIVDSTQLAYELVERSKKSSKQ